MRKILVGLLSLFALVLLAENVHVPGCEFESYTIDSSITIYVHQWMDLDYEWLISEFDICDYDQEFGEVGVLNFTLDSNADVAVIPYADFNGLDAWVDADFIVLKDGVPFAPTSPISDGTYNISFQINSVDPDLPAGDYTVYLSLTFQPTVSF
ncbi:hypothetical protein SU69_06330 [Thermosipho melanesiensis]|uniref:Uncharacterized protein n=2 Tax=Thermosipho melanesiensis TaxID=46541 RepID=A6LME8_THEM4|nr:hypothetical protein [Thermosipho melanesiensis]ABR31099.1 hypothetical protein Tmel_1246 [Thermosipho melanesiensis BI429]APT74194.1 hypothetical protein BW47_06630 [Thermosipho melanesiensis]OOC36137.1 hypothetical protein SU68_06400 [Thermosipho melanesiensis]OOC36954.1 hypothetical protein SU69_06330 [Thermosipho melanesiensis]OOC37706.1 hypothetical protein SU70_06340 [Thermosipho melanesiensis]